VRGGSKQFEIVQFHIQAPSQRAEEGRHLEWVEEYSGDDVRKRYRIRNFTDEDYDAIKSVIQTVEPIPSQQTPSHEIRVPPPQIRLSKPVARVTKANVDSPRPSYPTEGKLSVPCPKCSSTLVIIRSRTSGKRFIGCSGRLNKTTDCTFGLPLPQSGTISLLNKRCPKCGFQMIQLELPDRRAFASCPNCYGESLQSKTA
jgi:hypothetical protein